MEKRKWWGYKHTSGSLQAKRYFGYLDIEEANESPFCDVTFGPFEAENREEALEIIGRKLLNIQKIGKADEVVEDFYFTFGQDHWHRDGMPMKDVWVRVSVKSDPKGSGYMKSRLIFIERFSSQYMEKPDKWSFQYAEKDFNRQYFPRGEFEHIIE